MRYVCIKCGKKWNGKNKSEDVSGSICKKCIKEYIHKKQVGEGKSPCFSGIYDCWQWDCKYWETCQRPKSLE